jgi:hypothetical protein
MRNLEREVEMKKNRCATLLETNQNGIPAFACYREGNHLVFTCPFCSKKHYHGAFGEFGEADGYRVSHCLSKGGPPSYYLKEVEDPRMAGI